MRKKLLPLLLFTILTLSSLAACGNKNNADSTEVNIGYFPNLTHITTIVALENGYFEDTYPNDIQIHTKTVSNGGLFMEAMATQSIDVGTVGPGPALNIFVKDPSYHIISGAVNGGAVLVTSDHSQISSLEELDGKKIAIPVIGSTQDVMLRKALQTVDLKPTTNGGTVELFAAAPADTATLFIQESVDATATQEPWGYILESQAGGNLLLDWESFAWGKDSTNTVVVAREGFLENEELTKAYLNAHIKAVEFIEQNPEESQALVINHIKELTGKEIDKEEVAVAFSRLQVTTSVNEQVIQEMATISEEAGYATSDDVSGFVRLELLKSLE